jgi:hypothetical protein
VNCFVYFSIGFLNLTGLLQATAILVGGMCGSPPLQRNPFVQLLEAGFPTAKYDSFSSPEIVLQLLLTSTSLMATQHAWNKIRPSGAHLQGLTSAGFDP